MLLDTGVTAPIRSQVPTHATENPIIGLIPIVAALDELVSCIAEDALQSLSDRVILPRPGPFDR
jgi:hypothetical protein